MRFIQLPVCFFEKNQYFFVKQLEVAVKITILNGNMKSGNLVFNDYLKGLADSLEMVGHSVNDITLYRKTIKQCRGCWKCWVKTPGNCIYEDDMDKIYSKIIASDLLILASPISMGFVSSLLKKATERLIPLVLPYFKIIKGEFHHKNRYTDYPYLGLILEKEITTKKKDIQIIEHIFERTAINFHSSLAFTHLVTESEKEVINAINNL